MATDRPHGLQAEQGAAPETWRGPPQLCPYCGYLADAATPTLHKGAVPQVGDFAICLSCGGVLVFGLGMLLRRASAADLLDVPASLADALRQWASMPPEWHRAMAAARRRGARA
jgi:hypothetical protein